MSESQSVTVVHLKDTPSAAVYLDVGEETLKRWRRLGTGPAYIRLAHSRVRYRVSDLDAWLDAQTVRPGDQD